MKARRLLLIVGAAALLGALFWSLGPGRRPPATTSRVVDPPSPYINTRPGVQYVGDAVCSTCHKEIAATYREHPMGRSLGPIDDASPGRPALPPEGVVFEAFGFTYQAERRDGKVVHKETRRDRSGRVLSEVEAEINHALGSGARGVSYLFERDGFLFQSPISWYSQERRWDLAPGYARDNPHFGRAIDRDCLFCHANRVKPVAGTENRYEAPTFRGHSIGCERCHGPGALHAATPVSGVNTIVNPDALEPELRDSVCQQCHLQGSGRFARAGRDPFDYRPGLPLRRFLAVFNKTSGADFQAVGHVEQMGASRCYQASGGRLGCTSCHDPHRLPSESSKASFYRDRCLKCHAQKGCNAPPADRRRVGDDCVSCHMPRRSLTNIVHTAATDHRVPRRAGESPVAPPSPAAGAAPLADFFTPWMTAAERLDAGRDLGLALVRVGQQSARLSPASARAAGTMTLPLLQRAIAVRADDLPAREAAGTALRFLGRTDEALGVFRSVVAASPRRESALRSLASTLAARRDLAPASDAWRAVLAVNPWHADDHLGLAEVCAERHDWPAAAVSCRDALRLNPALLDARSLLVRVYLGSGDAPRARIEFEALVGFTPAGRAVWEDWYQAKQAEAAAGQSGGLSPGRPKASSSP